MGKSLKHRHRMRAFAIRHRIGRRRGAQSPVHPKPPIRAKSTHHSAQTDSHDLTGGREKTNVSCTTRVGGEGDGVRESRRSKPSGDTREVANSYYGTIVCL